jgi:hypothetical protein
MGTVRAAGLRATGGKRRESTNLANKHGVTTQYGGMLLAEA